MPESTLELPQEISWKLLAVSPDMMDTRFCNKRFPFRWRSSLAISAAEPKPEDVPAELCEGRITFLKITATITGYQPSREETEEGHASFPDVPTEEISRIIDQYFACYGALLHVAVFPNPNRKAVDKEVMIDFTEQHPENVLPNPFETQDVTFDVKDQPNNLIIDIFPAGGDGKGELNLFQQLVVTLPATSRVKAKVVHFTSAGVTMEAFKGATSIGSAAAGPEQGQVHELVIEGEGIDRLIIDAPQNEAALLQFAYLVKGSKPFDLIEFPHIIDCEPKMRDLIQAGTEAGEILTTSKSGVNTNKSLTNTEKTETSYDLGAKVKIPLGEKAEADLTGGLKHTNTETDEDKWSVTTEASLERKEKRGSTTQISQLYNLLSSYHLDTNRAVFLMLARPHVLQATDHRTFVDGLRKIEGTQQFFLIVSRRPEIKGLCIEVLLETGHFPEGLEPQEPPEAFDEDFEEFRVVKNAGTGFFSGDEVNLGTTYDILRTDFVIDPTKGDDGHPGISEISDDSNNQAKDSLKNYNYRGISPTSVVVEGSIQGGGVFGDSAKFDRKYRVFTRSLEPKPNTAEPQVPIEKLLITTRGLCVCFRSGEECPGIDPRPIFEFPDGEFVESIVDEPEIRVNPDVLTRDATRETRLPAMKDLLTEIQNAMATSGRLPRRRAFGAVGFLESDYFKDQIQKLLPRDHLKTRLADVSGLPSGVVESLGENATVSDALRLDFASFVRKTRLDIDEAAAARRRLLGMTPVPRRG